MPDPSDQYYIVVVRADAAEDGMPGEYVLASQTFFPDRDAACWFAAFADPARQPIVVEACAPVLVRDDFEARYGELYRLGRQRAATRDEATAPAAAPVGWPVCATCGIAIAPGVALIHSNAPYCRKCFAAALDSIRREAAGVAPPSPALATREPRHAGTGPPRPCAACGRITGTLCRCGGCGQDYCVDCWPPTAPLPTTRTGCHGHEPPAAARAVSQASARAAHRPPA